MAKVGRRHLERSWYAQPLGNDREHPEANIRSVCWLLCHNLNFAPNLAVVGNKWYQVFSAPHFAAPSIARSQPPPPPPSALKPEAGSPGRDADQGPQGVWVWKLQPPVSDWVSGGLRGSESSARQPVAQAADT